MNRQIKFRAMSRFGRHEWLYGSLVKLNDKYFVLPEIKEGKSFKEYEVIKETIGQFTNTIGIDGKEIYEGDIVEWCIFDHNGNDSHRRGHIAYERGCAVFVVKEATSVSYPETEDISYPLIIMGEDTRSDAEIIGNIYDNKDVRKEIQERVRELQRP